MILSTKTKVWTEELIQNELRCLDKLVYKKKGIILEGAAIPIKFENRKTRLGYFSIYEPEFCFGFSLYYFNDDAMPEEVCLDVIRHEYAHYYAYVVFCTVGHNKPWRAACQVVGASPSRCYTTQFRDYKKRIEDKQNRIYTNLLNVGVRLLHRRYGEGTIQEIKIYRDVAVETVVFDSGLIKKLDEAWIIDNCEIIDSGAAIC